MRELTENSAVDATTIPDSALVVDDGARHAETVAHKDRMPSFDKNGLRTCPDVVFTSELKRSALNLVRPA